MNSPAASAAPNFIRHIVADDLANGRNEGRVVTRFPPEPNGYLHIGHAKSICLNFGVARDFGGHCSLRFDDTNPVKEDVEYVEAIKADVRWLGFDWGTSLRHASDYFEQLYAWAEELTVKGLAYVCDLRPEQIREYRGTLTEAGRDSPFRDRSVEQNLDLLRRMRAGEFGDGEKVLRAKIDMASPNINMRDPVLYRIKHASHPMTGDAWCIYPMYDYTHCLSDAIEHVTHSLCTLEFEDHRPLYDWCLDNVSAPCHPRQIEFSRLALEYTVMSKRKLNALLASGRVRGWDDPRMPTLVGMRRRGCTPAALRDFCERIGVTKSDNSVEMALLENSMREDLDRNAPRALAVLRPLKVVIDNYPQGQSEHFEAPNHPANPDMGTRQVPFSREIWIERDDFMEEPVPKYFRLAPGREVRLRFAYFITCTDVVKDADGNLVEVHASYDPATRGGNAPDGRKVKGTIHWVSEKHAGDVEVRLYDRLFAHEDLNDIPEGTDWRTLLNPGSLKTIRGFVEPALLALAPSTRVQFERTGYFCADAKDSQPGKPVFNRTVGLKDSWAKAVAK